ncbi:hypothetical protein Ddc_16469 [Ditylenchus destructor]|nr:hypothetical protein Ddc_16469 [Ditylenchus destructor]
MSSYFYANPMHESFPTAHHSLPPISPIHNAIKSSRMIYLVTALLFLPFAHSLSIYIARQDERGIFTFFFFMAYYAVCVFLALNLVPAQQGARAIAIGLLFVSAVFPLIHMVPLWLTWRRAQWHLTRLNCDAVLQRHRYGDTTGQWWRGTSGSWSWGGEPRGHYFTPYSQGQQWYHFGSVECFVLDGLWIIPANICFGLVLAFSVISMFLRV